MSGVKLYRREDQDFTLKHNPADGSSCLPAFVNASNSSTMGGGLGVFGAGSHMEWTVTYDELLFIHSGNFQLKVGDKIYHAGPGDTLWIPKDTAVTYITEEDVWIFFAVFPYHESPAGSKSIVYPDSPPSSVK